MKLRSNPRGIQANSRSRLTIFRHEQKQHPEYGTLTLPTREFEHGKCITVDATWVEYPEWSSCFHDRMATLTRLSTTYPHYAMALEASTAEAYVSEVSLSWSTDPQRAAKCIAIYHAQGDILK